MVQIPFFSSHWEAEGKHALVTGGSQGLGLALATELVRRGADVTIVARTVSKLEKAVADISSARKSSQQKVSFYSANLCSFEGAAKAISWAVSGQDETTPSGQVGAQPVGRVPDAVFCCAGGAKPGWFLEQSEADFQAGFQTDYMTALATAHASAKAMVESHVKGSIVLVSSTVGLMGLVGYSQYSPMKFAIRGLAETLRSELLLYGINIHCYFPGTILSPGYELENKTKPQLTKELEGPPEEGLTPEQCAKGLLKGLARGDFFITTDFQSELFRAATATGGSIPSNNWLFDRIKASIALIGLPIWRRFIHDRTIRAHAPRHSQEVRKRRGGLLLTHPCWALFLLSFSHRLAATACLIILPFLAQSFDSSADLITLSPSSGHTADRWHRICSHLIRWDSLHFLGAGSPEPLPLHTSTAGGYAFEHTLAFQPGLIWLLRSLGGIGAANEAWSWQQSVALTSSLSVLLGATSPVLLFCLLRSTMSRGSSIPITASILSILSPAPSTMVTPTPEPFYAFFALLGLVVLFPNCKSISLPRIGLASIAFAAATMFRANGVLLSGYLVYAALWQRPVESSLLLRLVLLLPTALLVSMTPFLLGQVWAWNRFCSTSSERPWCHVGLGSVYDYVQAEYWDVGFLRYWQLSQVPNFALAAPVLTVAVWGGWSFLSRSPSRVISHVLHGWIAPTGTQDSSTSSRLSFDKTPRLLPHVLLSLAYVYLLLFHSHTQIALRFASPAWIGFWMAMADVAASSSSKLGRVVVIWLVSWNLVSLVLYAAFLPPA